MDFISYEDQSNYIGTSCGIYLMQVEYYCKAKNSDNPGLDASLNHERDKAAALAACHNLENLCYDMTYTQRTL